MLSKPVFCVLALGALAYLANAAPLLGFEDESEADTAIVESTVREVRAVKTDESQPSHAHFHKKYDSGNKGNIGFTRQKADKGKTGYQQFDSFHKKGGDSYGFEKHDSFGHEDKSSAGAHDGDAGAGHHDEGEETKKVDHQSSPDDSSAYEVIEESDGDEEGDEEEGGDEAADDGEKVSESEAGIADSGYDEDDAANYDNPTEYTYGSGNEYDFK